MIVKIKYFFQSLKKKQLIMIINLIQND